VAVTGNLGATLQDHIDFSRIAHDLGADMVMLTAPSDLDSDKDLLDYFLSIADCTFGKLGLYECPYPRHFHLSLTLVKDLADSGRFYAFKETSCETGKIRKVMEVIDNTNLVPMQANIPFFLDAQLAGANGSMNVVANWLPDLTAEVFHKVSSGETQRAQELHNALCTMEMVQRSIHPTGVKYLMSQRGVSILPNSRRDQKFTSEVKKSLDICCSRWFDASGNLQDEFINGHASIKI
jgi:4-hydroxy-tetrahydrodipicolinate synthase